MLPSTSSRKNHLPSHQNALPPELNHCSGKPSLITGTRAAFQICHYWLALLAHQHRNVHILDCAIRFNLFDISRYAKELNATAAEFLENISFQRAFTPYQILDAVSSFNRKDCLQVILAPCKQFLDGDVALDEGLFLLKKLVTIFKQRSLQNYPLLIVEKNDYQHSVFNSIFPELTSISFPIWQVNTSQSGEIIVSKTSSYEKYLSRSNNGQNTHTILKTNSDF